jgi:hypothetical protein
LKRRLNDDLRFPLRYRPPRDVEALRVGKRVRSRSRLRSRLVLNRRLWLTLRLIYLRSRLHSYWSIACVLGLWYRGLLLLKMLRAVVGLCVPAILLCAVGTGKGLMASLLSIFL